MRPTKIFRGTQSPLRNATPGSLDWVIIRENSEGEYAGHGGRSHRGHPWETATEVSIFTRHAVERVIRFAFEVAQKRPRKHLTVVTKSNAQRNGMVLWDEIAAEIAKEFTDVTVEKMLVDAMTCRMVLKPESLDTIVATNLVCSSLHPFPQPRLTPTTARRHPLGPRGRAGRQHRDRPYLEPGPDTPEPEHVRADPRIRIRHHGPGRRQPGRDVLDRRRDARVAGRRRRRTAPARVRRARLRERRRHEGPRWQREDR